MRLRQIGIRGTLKQRFRPAPSRPVRENRFTGVEFVINDCARDLNRASEITGAARPSLVLRPSSVQ
jgi:hypothetical protein